MTCRVVPGVCFLPVLEHLGCALAQAGSRPHVGCCPGMPVLEHRPVTMACLPLLSPSTCSVPLLLPHRNKGNCCGGEVGEELSKWMETATAQAVTGRLTHRKTYSAGLYLLILILLACMFLVHICQQLEQEHASKEDQNMQIETSRVKVFLGASGTCIQSFVYGRVSPLGCFPCERG